MPGFVARHSSSLPDNESKYSREGTEAHECAKNALVLGVCERSMFPSKETYRHVKGYFEIIDGWSRLPGAKLFVEEKVALFYDETNEGTTDAAVVTNDNRIFIGDLKYGAGVSVQAEKNPQITIYAVSFIARLIDQGYQFRNDTLVVLMIYQPRVLGEQAIRLWSVKLSELLAFGSTIGDVAASIIADPDGGVFAPDDKTCQFCHAASICTARAGGLLGATPKATKLELLGPPAPSAYPEPESLTHEQIARIIRVAPSLKEWLNKCEAFVSALLLNGKKFKGFKHVEGRSNRKWSDETSVVEFLHLLEIEDEDLFDPASLKSPSQIDELLKELDVNLETRKELSSWIEKPQGKPTLVPEDDPRPEFDANPTSGFKSLTPGAGLLE